MSDKINVSPDDMLAMLAFRAQQIVSACGARASGAPFPDPLIISRVIAEMVDVADRIRDIMPPIKSPN